MDLKPIGRDSRPIYNSGQGQSTPCVQAFGLACEARWLGPARTRLVSSMFTLLTRRLNIL
jgi:hypothetical protein